MNVEPLLDETYETTAGPRSVRQMIEGGQRTVFIAYPMDFTPVCTRQLCSYRDHWEELSKLPCRWWGINQAGLEKHQRFKEEKSLPFELIADAKGTLLRQLGLIGLLGTKRGFAVVSPEGEVIGSSAVFPFFYKRHDDVIAHLRPWLEA